MDEVRSVLRESEGMYCSLHMEDFSLTTKGNAIAESIRPDDVFRYMFGASTGG